MPLSQPSRLIEELPAEESEPTTAAILKDEQTGVAIEVLVQNDCYLLRSLLRADEQATLFQYIQEQDRTPWDTLTRVMVPAPKTLMFGENKPSLQFKCGENSLVGDMVETANEILERNNLGWSAQHYKALSMAAIQYKSPDGHFPPHVDHSNNSFVYLMSLGCTANFMVKGPDMTSKKTFKFHSGDLLVFKPSTDASILHGVISIIDGEGSCPVELGKDFPILQSHRYGVQCRVHF
jgi:hypothetical protein